VKSNPGTKVSGFFYAQARAKKYAAKAAHGPRGEQEKRCPLLDCTEELFPA